MKNMQKDYYLHRVFVQVCQVSSDVRQLVKVLWVSSLVGFPLHVHI